MYASCIAGMSFSNSMLGAVHSMANGLSTKFDLSQGEVSGVLLPHVIVYNASKSEQVRRPEG
jgi:alcohol dehydrogenase class IV